MPSAVAKLLMTSRMSAPSKLRTIASSPSSCTGDGADSDASWARLLVTPSHKSAVQLARQIHSSLVTVFPLFIPRSPRHRRLPRHLRPPPPLPRHALLVCEFVAGVVVVVEYFGE